MEMTTKVWIITIFICVFFGGLIGYMSRGPGTTMALAWGFQEDKDVWNRIRVDERGYVLCHKE